MKHTLLIITALMLIYGCIKPIDGKRNSKSIHWYENGQKSIEVNYKGGHLNGLWTGWYENGKKYYENTLKDGKRNDKSIWWYENGRKWEEITYKDGEKDGEYTIWHENGKKWEEITYKDGKLIVKKCWDEDENKCECAEYHGCKF